MIRQTDNVRINNKCKEGIKYYNRRVDPTGSYSSFNCVYYDHKSNKCELNGCIKNLKGGKNYDGY